MNHFRNFKLKRDVIKGKVLENYRRDERAKTGRVFTKFAACLALLLPQVRRLRETTAGVKTAPTHLAQRPVAT